MYHAEPLNRAYMLDRDIDRLRDREDDINSQNQEKAEVYQTLLSMLGQDGSDESRKPIKKPTDENIADLVRKFQQTSLLYFAEPLDRAFMLDRDIDRLRDKEERVNKLRREKAGIYENALRMLGQDKIVEIIKGRMRF